MKKSRSAQPAIFRFGGWVLVGVAVVYAAAIHHGVGPVPKDPALQFWATPLGFLDAWAPRPWSRSLLAFGGVSAALAISVFATTRSAIARSLAVSAMIAVGLCVVFGVGPDGAWKLFHWRGSGVIGLLAILLGAVVCAPLLARSWSHLSWPARCATYLPVFLAVVALQRNVTGTNPDLPLALSPWPIVPAFGLEILGACAAAIWLGAGLGLQLISRSSPTIALRVPLGIVLAGALPAAWLAVGGALDLFPFEPGRGLLLGAALLAALVLGLAALVVRPRREGALPERALAMWIGGAMLGLPIALGQGLTRLDYASTREVQAQGIIDGLSSWIDREGSYPDGLEELVTAGDLDDVPLPGIGFSWLSDQEFVFQNFGANYLLEFSSPRWVQCAYNPPWTELDDEIVEEDDEQLDSGGAWSCPSRSPKLW